MTAGKCFLGLNLQDVQVSWMQETEGTMTLVNEQLLQNQEAKVGKMHRKWKKKSLFDIHRSTVFGHRVIKIMWKVDHRTFACSYFTLRPEETMHRVVETGTSHHPVWGSHWPLKMIGCGPGSEQEHRSRPILGEMKIQRPSRFDVSKTGVQKKGRETAAGMQRGLPSEKSSVKIVLWCSHFKCSEALGCSSWEPGVERLEVVAVKLPGVTRTSCYHFFWTVFPRQVLEFCFRWSVLVLYHGELSDSEMGLRGRKHRAT